MMKLLVITSLKEYQKNVSQIMDLAGIPVFSVTETIGFKDHHKPNLLDSWFGAASDQFDSIFLFSFTEAMKAEQALSLVTKYNADSKSDFPIRAFILPVEKTT